MHAGVEGAPARGRGGHGMAPRLWSRSGAYGRVVRSGRHAVTKRVASGTLSGEVGALDVAREVVCAVFLGREGIGPRVLRVVFRARSTALTMERLAPAPMPLTERLRGQAAHLLARTHCLGLYHGDVKSANMGIAADGTLRLLDFGHACWDPESPPRTLLRIAARMRAVIGRVASLEANNRAQVRWLAESPPFATYCEEAGRPAPALPLRTPRMARIAEHDRLAVAARWLC
jgi:hypothetical protein